MGSAEAEAAVFVPWLLQAHAQVRRQHLQASPTAPLPLV